MDLNGERTRTDILRIDDWGVRDKLDRLSYPSMYLMLCGFWLGGRELGEFGRVEQRGF